MASSHTNKISALLHLGESVTSGSLRLNVFIYPWKYEGSYAFTHPTSFPPFLSKFLAGHVTGQFRLLIPDAPCWIEPSWLPSVFSMLKDIPYQCPIIKDLVSDTLLDDLLKGLP